MQQPPHSPVSERRRTVRRRITAAVLATFVAAWLAVAALGKGGATTTTAAPTAWPSTRTSSQSDEAPDAGSVAGDDEWSHDDSASPQGGDSSATQGAAPGPVTTSQS
jgi:hypothetical protein